MCKITIVALLLVLAIVLASEAAGFGRHHLCGARFLNTIIEVCPNGCDPNNDFEYGIACYRRMNKDDLKSFCCPSA